MRYTATVVFTVWVCAKILLPNAAAVGALWYFLVTAFELLIAWALWPVKHRAAQYIAALSLFNAATNIVTVTLRGGPLGLDAYIAYQGIIPVSEYLQASALIFLRNAYQQRNSSTNKRQVHGLWLARNNSN